MASLAARLLLPFTPPLRTLRRYDAQKFRKDLFAGMTVAVVEVPQAMAYALIAGVPPQYGLYTSILQGTIGALLSSSEHMATGPTNTQALLTASAATLAMAAANPQLAPGTDAYGQAYLQLVFGLTLLKGIVQLLFAAARMGEMVRYVSRSVIAGLAAGAGVLIIVGQLGNLLGVRAAPVDQPWPGVVGSIQKIWPNLQEADLRALLLAAVTLAIVLGMRKVSRFLPGSLLAVVVTAAAVWGLGWYGDFAARGAVVGDISGGFATFHVPELSVPLARTLLGGAVALAILGMIESVAIAKSIAAHTGQSISPNQEFFAQGLKNTVTSFFQCIPGSGSFSRSALDYAAGAQTRFAAVYNAGFVALIYFTARPLAAFIPLAALAGVLWVVAFGLFDFRYIARIIRTSKGDTLVCLITCAATLLAPLEYAIFIGVFLNLALYLHGSSQLRMAQMVPPEKPGGVFQEVALADRRGRVLLLQPEGSLFFGLADELADKLAAIERSDAQVVILRLKRTHAIDSTVLGVLERFVRDMQSRNAHVLACGVRPELLRKMTAFGLVDLMRPENVFPAEAGIFESTRRALERAAALSGATIDTNDVARDDREPEAFAYEI